MSKNVIMGIYKITNMENGKFYIGSSNNIYSRWKEHVNELSKNKHGNSYFQRAWNKYGETSFRFEIIHTTENVEDLIPLEQAYLDMLTPWKRNIGYNISMYSDCALRGRKRPMSARKKQSEVVRGENNHFYGKTHDKRVREIISESNKGRFSGENSSTVKLTWEDVRNIRELYKTMSCTQIAELYPIHVSGIKYIIKNKTWYDENYQPPKKTKEFLENRRKANQTYKTKPVVMLDTESKEFIREFPSIKEAAGHFGRKTCADICAVCKGKQVTAYGYKWMYKSEYQQTS